MSKQIRDVGEAYQELADELDRLEAERDARPPLSREDCVPLYFALIRSRQCPLCRALWSTERVFEEPHNSDCPAGTLAKWLKETEREK